ncbi:MAG TPA: winged helix-turn-helix domain-containing protein [Bryobacteraceae bacterium]|nr:winged helix-turn-helix domain-containing protein [Bryobacteraceae bacterium]
MVGDTHQRQSYRFGAYEVTPHSRELRKAGTRIKLHEQPFAVLLALLEKPGELVSREDLRRRLWPADTVVDFDKGLNTAVNNVRQALRDSAAAPRYIETIPRHGYRFIADVEKVEAPGGLGARPDTIEQPVPVPGQARSARLRDPLLAGTAAAAMIVLLLIMAGRRGGTERSDSNSVTFVPLTSYPGIEQAPSFSPDGSQVAFERRRTSSVDFDICVQVVGAPESVDVAATPANEISPAWSPDGSAIAYLRSSSDTRMDLMLVPPTGGEPRKLTNIRYPSDNELRFRSDLLTWTADGSAVVFPDADVSNQASLWRVNARSGQRERITFAESRASHSVPRFSEDGRWLAFQQQGGQHYAQVYAVRLSAAGLPAAAPIPVVHAVHASPLGWIGSDLLVLVRSNTRYTIQRWSGSPKLHILKLSNAGGHGVRFGSGALTRDGRRFALTLSTTDTDIWHMDLSESGEGRNLKPLIESTYLDLSVDYSHDGSRILFKSTRSGGHEAWMAAADGSNLRQITQANGLGDPRLSPDGKQIVFDRGEDGNGDIFVADVETGVMRRITNHPATDGNARWSRDGHWIYFNSDRTGRQEIWKVRPSGQDAVQVTQNGGFNGFESHDRKHLYYGKESDGEGYVWRMPLRGGPEERLFPALINWTSLALGSRRLYFLRHSPPSPRGHGSTIYSYDFASERIRKVADVGATIYTLSPSPDEQRLIFGRANPPRSDLVLAEGLRK